MVGGRWDEDVAFEHINSLELFAAKSALEKLAGSIHDFHIQLKMDNTTAVTHNNRMGGSHSVSCNFYTQLIWHWAQETNVWLSAAYLPGKDNVVADFHSRCFKDDTEWTLDYAVFRSSCHIYSLYTCLPRVILSSLTNMFIGALIHMHGLLMLSLSLGIPYCFMLFHPLVWLLEC